MALSFLWQRWLQECTIHVHLSFNDDQDTSFDTATSDKDIAATAICMVFHAFAFGMYPIPLDLGVLTAHANFPLSVS